MTDVPTSEQLFHFSDDLEKSLSYDPGVVFDCDNIILCGVGGSAVSGYIAADCYHSSSSKPIRLIRYPAIPSWAGSRTLAVISSYSGNTAETLEIYNEAKARGCVIVAVTSGGKLRDVAEADGNMLALLPEGMHPRHAIGYMIGYTLALIRSAGCPDLSEEIRSFIPDLRRYRDEVVIPEGGQAWMLSRRFMGKVPVVCADSSMGSVAFRWKTQINENSKFVAFCESAPLFNAQALDGWVRDSRENYAIAFLMGCDGQGTGSLEDAFKQLAGTDCDPVAIDLGGTSALENMFRAIILGDYVSVYMAQIRGIDPAEVRPVMQMKEKLSRSLD